MKISEIYKLLFEILDYVIWDEKGKNIIAYKEANHAGKQWEKLSFLLYKPLETSKAINGQTPINKIYTEGISIITISNGILRKQGNAWVRRIQESFSNLDQFNEEIKHIDKIIRCSIAYKICREKNLLGISANINQSKHNLTKDRMLEVANAEYYSEDYAKYQGIINKKATDIKEAQYINIEKCENKAREIKCCISAVILSVLLAKCVIDIKECVGEITKEIETEETKATMDSIEKQMASYFRDKIGKKNWWDNYPELAKGYWDGYKYISVDKYFQSSYFCDRIPYNKVYSKPVIFSEESSWNLRVCKGKIIFLEAPNSCGKTTFLRGILLGSLGALAESDEERAFFVELASFHGIEENSLVLYCEAKELKYIPDNREEPLDVLYKSNNINTNYLTKREEFCLLVKEFNSSKNLIILIDGLDEVDEKTEYNNLFSWIEKVYAMGSGMENATIVIASRPQRNRLLFTPVIKGKFCGYFQIESWKFNDSEKNYLKGFINKYIKFCSKKDVKSDDVCCKITSNYYLRKLPVTPYIILKAMESVLDSNQKCDVIEVVDNIIEEMLKRHSGWETDSYSIDIAKSIYAELSYYMLTTENGLTEKRFRKCLGEVGKTVKNQYEHGMSRKKVEGLFDDISDFENRIYTQNGLLKKESTTIKFLIPDVLEKVFCANRFKRILIGADDAYKSKGVFEELKNIPFTSRYEIVMMLAVIIDTYEENRYVEYLIEQYEQCENGDEKVYIKKAIYLLLTNSYGEIALTRVNNISKNQEDIQLRKKLIEIIGVEYEDGADDAEMWTRIHKKIKESGENW